MISKNTFLSTSYFFTQMSPKRPLNDSKLSSLGPSNPHLYEKNYLLTFLDGVWFFILALFVSLVSTSVLCLSCKIAFFAIFIFLFCFDWNCFSEHCLYVRTENVRNCLSFWLIFWMRSLPRLLRKQKLSSSSRVSRSRVARSSSTMTHDYYEDHILYYLECPGSAIELIRAGKRRKSPWRRGQERVHVWRTASE